ncbi:MAG TPA: DUF5808 domain-containing protein [Acidobacteriaceae bacterium]|jgi:uncharacterized membrane protein
MRDDPWIGGIFYYNPQDPSLWVEKRSGLGWTLNFAHRGSWWVLGALLIPVAVGGGLAWFSIMSGRH